MVSHTVSKASKQRHLPQRTKRRQRITRRMPAKNLPTRALLIAGIVAAGVLVLVVGVTIASASPSVALNRKQQAVQMQAQWKAAHDRSPAAKQGGQSAIACVVIQNQPPQIVNLSGQAPLPGQNYNSYIRMTSTEGTPYTVFGEVNQLAVQVRPQNPCSASGALAPIHFYPAPQRVGQLTLTAVQGDVVTFTTAAHTTGRFNYVTGQYLDH